MDINTKDTINNFFDSNFYKIYDLNIKYVMSLILGIFQDSLIKKELEVAQGVSPEELIESLKFSKKADSSLKWMLDFSSENGILEKLRRDGKFYYCNANTNFDLNRIDISDKILNLDPNFKPSVDLMNLVARNYISFLKGEKKGVEILFSPEGMRLWSSYFNNQFSGYKAFNVLGACAIIDILKHKEKVSILELGGGTGGAKELLFSYLDRFGLLNRVEKYVFSDISPMFVRLGNKRYLDEQFGQVNYFSEKINFDLPLTEQGIEKDSIDLVYGVNALHVAKDLIFSFKSIKEVLKKSGMVVVSELVRDNNNNRLFQEIIFNLLESYSEVSLDPVLRPLPGFLSKDNWVQLFQKVGLTNIKTVTNATSNKQCREIAVVVQGVK